VRAVPSLLVVPSNGEALSSRKLPIMYAPPIPVRVKRIFHTVKRGETFASIAKRYGVLVEDLKRWNPGQSLRAGRSSSAASGTAPTTRTASSGST